MKYNIAKKFKKKFKFNKKERTGERRRFTLKKKQIQIPNFLLAERILRGTVNLEALKEVQNRKNLRNLQGKHSDISLEKLIIKNVKEGKKQRLKKLKEGNKEARENAERMAIFKLKKEPEKNKTHWDHLLEEMKWMENDFEKERKLKKKKAAEMSKFAKKSIDTRHLEVEKRAKRVEMDLKRMCGQMAKSVNNYWRKIEKLTKHNYNVLLQENKLIQQQNRLLGFINKLQKISGRVADSLPSKNLLSGNKMQIDSVSGDKSSINLNINLPPSELPLEEDIVIMLKKNEDGTFSLMDNSIENMDENLVAKVAHTAERFQPKGTDLSSSQVHLEQPFLLKHTLREYQLIGLHWLTALHDNKINGILADEMGLGKTIQTIALLADLAGKRGNWGPHLIIVPTTIIINWEIEFKKWCPGLKILSYYGNQKERKAKRYGWHKPNSFNVCITSYKLVIQDYSIFKRKRWYYIILDEAQNIKNFKSKRWQMLLNFKAKRKLLLTGTPLQNDVMEIWSYLHFLMPNLFYSNEEFRDWFYSQFHNAIHNNAALNKKMIQSLHSILRPFLLRRLKKDVEKQLPEKIEHVVYCELTRRQKYLYDEFINSDKTQDTLKLNDYFSIMNVLMQLRKVCNHPDLFDTRDYVTPSLQQFEINYVIPYIVLKILAYNPMKSINLKNLNLILQDNEKLSLYDYMTVIKNFPQKPLFEVYTELINKERMLYSPKYLIDENDILFKRQFSDSTILYESNCEEIRKSLLSGRHPSCYNIPFPNYISPSNIPLLQNTSMSNYFDIMYDINTLDMKDQQEYLKSVFEDNIERKSFIMKEKRKKIMHGYDLISRRNCVYKMPVYGSDVMKVFKINSSIENANAINVRSIVLYGERFKERNMVTSVGMNKGYKYMLSERGNEKEKENDESINKERDYSDWNINYESVKENNENKEDNEDNEDETTLININNHNNDINNEEENVVKDNNEVNVEMNNNNINNNNNVIDINSTEQDNNLNDLPNLPTKKDFTKIPHIDTFKENFILSPNLTPEDTVTFLNTDSLRNMIMTPHKMLNHCEDLLDNFRIHIPSLLTQGIKPIPSKQFNDFNQSINRYKLLYNNLNRIPNVQKFLSMFKIISFPDKRLVEFDSGKLIKLAQLLKKLKKNKSKVLIFTQMTRMLDILERFLNLHGYTYVRLDGSTKVEVRQQVVDRFNNDAKVFCFISSTRSGGIGLNLTGADSIVFYDTDWNPAMDKQAQDRCHRIGQTRTVHIYRLITLSTIEENIFRKSIQKRELNYVIMEDGKFDMNNFKKINFKSIVEEENLLKSSQAQPPQENADDKIRKLLQFENLAFENEEEQKNIEQMLIRIEDQEDVQALKNLSKEMLDEYEKENNELQYIQEDKDEDEGKDTTKYLLKDPKLLSSLKGIDKFALKFYQNQYSFDDFVKEKENRNNVVYFPTPDESEIDIDEELEIGQSDEEDGRVSKLDLDQAYEMYLKKKKDILRTFELMAGATCATQNTQNIQNEQN